MSPHQMKWVCPPPRLRLTPHLKEQIEPLAQVGIAQIQEDAVTGGDAEGLANASACTRTRIDETV